MKRASRTKAEPPISVAQQRNELLQALQNHLIPRAREGNSNEFLILGLPPLEASGRIAVSGSLKPRRRASKSDSVEPGMKPLRFPRFAFVYKGEADLRVGVTSAMLRKNRALPAPLSHQVASLPAGHAIIFPSGVPLDTVPFPHWFRDEPERASSSIFWLVVLPDGMLMHTCKTEGTTHSRSAELYVKDANLLTLTEHLIDELRTRQVRYEVVARNYLITILSLVERALLNERAFYHPSESALSDNEGTENEQVATSTARGALQRACNFIETHVHERLTPELIARHASVSPTHLNRIFRDEKQTSVMRYVASHRIAVAKLLLKETQLPINEIATIVGIPDHAVFNRTFKRAAGLAPFAYRKQS